ncbi:MAG: dTDP-4-dehydrorhamnose 3,5-epimerase family protein, partial [Candidatus Tantalella remota]|nr:dTDP-4-dehydrorhamnose 3,5-epimerase family protein [Candidatus Tantalella remota]
MKKRFIFGPTFISGLWIAERKTFGDDRGAFARLFCAEELSEIGVNKPIVQINHSITRIKGTTRGLH